MNFFTQIFTSLESHFGKRVHISLHNWDSDTYLYDAFSYTNVLQHTSSCKADDFQSGLDAYHEAKYAEATDF